MSDFEDMDRAMEEDEEQLISSLDWLRERLNLVEFTTATLYFLVRLSADYDIGGVHDGLDEREKAEIVERVKGQLTREKREEARQWESFESALQGVAKNDLERKIARDLCSKAPRSLPQQSSRQQAESVELSKEPLQQEKIPVGLEVFSPQEREGIEAISMHRGVLCGFLPQVQVFREKYLPSGLLSTAQARAFLSSPALRYLSFTDIEGLGASVTDHKAKVLNQAVEVVTPEQRKRLKGQTVTYPSTVVHYGSLGKVHRWYKYTVSIEVTSGSTGATGSRSCIIEKTLVSDHKPVKLLRDPFFWEADLEGSENENTPGRFTRFFTSSVVEELYDLLISRIVMNAIPGGRREQAMFVLTDKADYRPVSVRTSKSIVVNMDASDAASVAAECLMNGKASHDSITIEADSWVTADTIREIYLREQASLMRKAHGATRYKISNQDSLRLVRDVLHIYIKQKSWPSYQGAYKFLQESGKIESKADNFRKRYQRACKILNLPFNIADVVEELRKRH